MKKIATIAMSAVLAASCVFFTACGEKKANSDTLLIGGSGPLTGSAAIYGIDVKNGAELAIKEINDAGGVNGMKLALTFQDDENDAQKGVNAYNKCVDDGAKLFLGTVTSTPCVSVVEETFANHMFQITPSASAKNCIAHDNAFRVCFNDPNQGKASAQYIAEKKLASKIAVIYDSSDVYSSGIYETFATAAKELNLDVFAQSFTSSNNTDFSVALQTINEKGADLIFLPIYYQQAALIIQQAAKANYNFKYFGCDGLDGLITQLAEDVALADGVMLLTGFAADASDAKSQAFVNAFTAAYGATPTQFAAASYDAVYTIKAALEKAGVKDASIEIGELCDKMVAAMTQITVDGVTGSITWATDGEPNKDAKAMKIVVDTADLTKTHYESMD